MIVNKIQGVDNMDDKTVLMNFKIKQSLKNDFSKICDELGMDMSTALTIFIKQMIRERKLPFTPNVASMDSKIIKEDVELSIEKDNNQQGYERFKEYMKLFLEKEDNK